MALRWGSKKEAEPADRTSPEQSAPIDHGADEAALLAQLIERISRRLGQTAEEHLGKQLDALAAKIDDLEKGLENLAEAGRLTPAPTSAPGAADASLSTLSEGLRAIEDRLGRLQQQLEQLPGRADSPEQKDTPETLVRLHESVGQLRTAVDSQREESAAALRRLRQDLEDRLQELVEYVRPDSPDAEAATPAGSLDWQRAILGPVLSADPALDFQRQQLLDGVLAGNPGACALAGQLLVFQSSPAEKMAPLLKEIGEAFYRWQPKDKPGTSKMEEALVAWLKRACEDAGIGNSIELVHPGERFDAARHTASSRGVEITRVHGWVVLRDNGKVYTKAAVDVR